MSLTPPAVLWTKVLRSSVRRRADNPLRQIRFDTGTAQILQTEKDSYINESFTLSVTAAEKDAVLDFFAACGAAYFSYPRADFAAAPQVRMTAPPTNIRQRSVNHFEMRVEIQYLRSAL